MDAPITAPPACSACGMSDEDCAEKYRTHEDIPCCRWCQHDGGPAPDRSPRSLEVITNEVSFAAETLRIDHPELRALADELSVIAARLREASR